MRRLNPRTRRAGAAGSALARSLRSASPGLPLSFVLTRDVRAAESGAKITIMGLSGQGESINVNGPGTYEAGQEAYFDHPRDREVGADKLTDIVVDGTALTGADLEQSAELELGTEVVRMAKAYGVLPAEMLRHMAFFYYRTNAGIHPQFNAVLQSFGTLQASRGRGSELLPSAIAQDLAMQLGTITDRPFVMKGSLSFNGAPLPSYSPTQVKQLANSVGQSIGGPENFSALYDHYIDETYEDIKRQGTAEQRRFLDQHASSKVQAAAFGDGLGQLLEGITDDTIESQMKTALVIAKLKLAPVVVVDLEFGGDGHGDSSLSDEAAETLRSIKAMHAYWTSAKELDVLVLEQISSPRVSRA